jgi:RNA polymerase sigma factor (TIGR02999 family)
MHGDTGQVTHSVTRLLGEITGDGGTEARHALIDLVYEELRKIARARMAIERPGHTLQATDQVHQAYLKLSPGIGERDFKNRHEFYAAAAEAMRRVLVDHARRRGAAKRGGKVELMPIDTVAELADSEDPRAVMAFNEAFELLAESQPQAADLIRLRFFASLSEAETAAILSLSERTLRRQWSMARIRLLEFLDGQVELTGR